ncbi:nucleoside-diphosphate sugar epimerase [Streptomyces sp. ICBB 8177]|nr:nucleoside-diphosphate sugar epimerase [Streptomyces sp. ICBB 8177]
MIVVTGATGNVGRSLVDQLLARDAPVRALTRSPEHAGLPEAAEVVRAEFGAGEPSPSLFEGADAVFLNLAATGPEAAVRLVDAAAKAGVRRVVLLSSAGVTDTPADEDNAISRMHAVVERAIRASGLEWTFVRGGMFATNTLEWAEAIRTTGVVRGPGAAARSAPVHEADLAAVATEALLDRVGTHDGQVYLVTGPEALTAQQMLDVIGAATGRTPRYEELTREEALAAMTARGLPLPIAEALVDWSAKSPDRASAVSRDAERVTGRPARTYAEWVADHAAAFA